MYVLQENTIPGFSLQMSLLIECVPRRFFVIICNIYKKFCGKKGKFVKLSQQFFIFSDFNSL